MIWSIDQAQDYLERVMESFPEPLFEQLNGGVILEEDAKEDNAFPPGEVFIMGEYITDFLGQSIAIYYGSFAALAKEEDWAEETWVKELRDTLSHELTHHMEWRSGTHALDDKDALELQWFQRGDTEI